MKNSVSLKTPVNPQSSRPGSGRIWLVGITATTLATLFNLAIGLAATFLFDVPADFEPLQSWAIAFTSILVGLGATTVFVVIKRFARNPIKLFGWISGIVLVVSILPLIPMLLMEPKYYPGTNLQTISTLFVIHLVTTAVCTGLLITKAHPQ